MREREYDCRADAASRRPARRRAPFRVVIATALIGAMGSITGVTVAGASSAIVTAAPNTGTGCCGGG